ncbi:MAG: hypothetical protein FWC16_07465 [Defluviitaleaceae bacterium]|nr:hypothetical protein [Defluviitaleaceae bacterium]MCL2274752.1 hypothetical protein [Defluviitaleaceae bacterium]
MQVNSGVSISNNTQVKMPEPAAGERWTGFNGYATDILRSMREAGFSEEEIASRRLHRELGSRFDTQTVKANFLYQRANGTGDRAVGTFQMGAPPAAHLANVENILLELIGNAVNEADDLHRTHWIQALQNMLANTRNMLNGSLFSATV